MKNPEKKLHFLSETPSASGYFQACDQVIDSVVSSVLEREKEAKAADARGAARLSDGRDVHRGAVHPPGDPIGLPDIARCCRVSGVHAHRHFHQQSLHAPPDSAPTIGHDIERFEHGDIDFTLFDVGGQRR